MPQAARTALVLTSLCVLLVVAGVWGLNAATQPFPGRTKPPVCVDTAVPAGQKVFPTEVTVSVYNAGSRTGLAGKTMGLLIGKGFSRGTTDDAPKGAKVEVATIWTDDPDSPAVQLVAAHLGPDTKVEEHKPRGPGVTVLVGDRFQKLADKAPGKVTAEADATICSPPVS